MSFLSGITQGVSKSGLRVVTAAQEKMGKTTLCAGAPGVLLVPCEVGFAGVPCPKTPMVQSWDQLWTCINEICQYVAAGQFPYKTLAFDSATAIERFIHEWVVANSPEYVASRGAKTVTMETAYGGFGKAYAVANTQFTLLLNTFDTLAVTYGINIVLTCHVFSSKVIDPTAGEFDCWDLLLHSPKNGKNYGKREMLTQWADILGFIYEPLFVSESGRVSKGISQNKGRVMGCSRTPSYVAGNRFGIVQEINLPVPPNNSWNALAEAVYSVSGIDVFNRA